MTKGHTLSSMKDVSRSLSCARAHLEGGKAAGFYDGHGVWTCKSGTDPDCILNNAWTSYFQALPDELHLTDNQKKLKLSVQFTLAITLVHEIAHALHIFPEYKSDASLRELYQNKEEAEGRLKIETPEAGDSWEFSMFGYFPTLDALALDPNHTWYENSQELSPKHDFVSLDTRYHKYGGLGPDVTKFFRGPDRKLYRLKSGHLKWSRTSVPLQWIANWFQKEHWADERSKKDICRSPRQKWTIEFWLPVDDGARQAEVVCVKVSGSSIVARQKSSNPFAILKDAPI
jgi:hypothetical protein